MIIGFDGSRAFVKNRTGTENYSYQVLKNLAKIDQKNNYFVYLRPGNVVAEKWPSNFQFKVLNYLRLWTQIGLSKQTFFDKLDVLFVPAHTLPIIRRPGLKTIVTVHDLGSEFLPQTHQIKQRLYLSFMQRQQLRGATKLIAVSKATKEDLVKKIGLDPKKITVVYEGFDQKLFKIVKNDLLVNSLKQFNLKPQEYFLFVGTIQPRKNLLRLIQAFSKYLARGGAEKLVLVGGKGWLAEEIYQLPEKLEIEKQVKFLGRVDDQDLPALYSGTVALVFPSLYEGFGLPILESQACGTPVITSNISSMPEVAGKGALYVDPYSIDDIVKGILRLRSGQVREKLIKKGFENIKRFSWEKCARETLKVLYES